MITPSLSRLFSPILMGSLVLLVIIGIALAVSGFNQKNSDSHPPSSPTPPTTSSKNY